jgi:hypothetical protein
MSKTGIPAMLAALAACLASHAAAAIYSDGTFNAANYDRTAGGTGTTPLDNTDVRFNFNYGNFDVFGDGFLTVSIPSAPRSGDSSTVGVFMTANSDSLNTNSGQQTFAAILPKNLNVGTGTANPNYVLRVDVFNSTGAGIDDGAGNLSLAGTTNYTLVGVNQANTTVQVRQLNAPASGNLTGQGLHVAMTGDSGGFDDYIPLYGGALYLDRSQYYGSNPGASVVGQYYNGTAYPVNTGLATKAINDYWRTEKGFTLEGAAAPTGDALATTLVMANQDNGHFSPDPDDLAGWKADGTGSFVKFFADSLPLTSGPVHYSGGGVVAPQTLAPNPGGVVGGVVSNRWSTHEAYWVDGTFTYVIDGVPILQKTAQYNSANPTQGTVFDPFSAAGSVLLGFWDRFGGSIANSPAGANFVVYDNLVVEPATAAQVPNMTSYLQTNGFLPAPPTVAGDFNADGKVDGADFTLWGQGFGTTYKGADLLVWQRAFGTGVSALAAVPEPSAMLLLTAAAVFGCVRRRCC